MVDEQGNDKPDDELTKKAIQFTQGQVFALRETFKGLLEHQPTGVLARLHESVQQLGVPLNQADIDIQENYPYVEAGYQNMRDHLLLAIKKSLDAR